jgi:hypothetical protein
LVEEHFATLGAMDVVDFGDGYSKILKPERATGTVLDHLFKAFVEILTASKLASWRHVNYFTFMQLFRMIEQLTGKGELVIEAIKRDRRFQIPAWEYQVLILYRSSI